MLTFHFVGVIGMTVLVSVVVMPLRLARVERNSASETRRVFETLLEAAHRRHIAVIALLTPFTGHAVPLTGAILATLVGVKLLMQRQRRDPAPFAAIIDI